MALRKIDYGPQHKFVLDAPFRLPGWMGLVAIGAVPAVVLLPFLPLPLVPPVLSLLSFVFACGFALYGLFTNASRDAQGVTVWNVAGVFAFIWLAAAVISKPKHLLDWFGSL
jgi:hypothetical protein